VACKTIRDFDIALRDPLVHTDDQGFGTPAEEFLQGVPKFLWAVAVSLDAVPAISLDLLTSGPAFIRPSPLRQDPATRLSRSVR
jgi:hypothetical protein